MITPTPNKKTRGRHPLGDAQRRLLFGRIAPQTEQFLRGLDAPNMGRAVDRAVSMLQDVMQVSYCSTDPK